MFRINKKSINILVTIFLLSNLALTLSADAKNDCPRKSPSECVFIKSSPPPTVAAAYSEYLTELYRYFLASVGICALSAMMYGGFLYVSSAGNPSRMGEGKKWIFNAIFGLLLAALSYVILNTINPDLVSGDLFNIK